MDLCALTATCKAFKAVIDGKNDKQQDNMFLNAIDREFPGIIREVEAMEVDAGRLVAGSVRALEVRTKDDFRPNGGAIVPKIEYKRLIQNQREREEARIREDSMNRMRENMSFRGGRGHGGNDNHRSFNPQREIVPGFPGFVPGITGGAYDLYPNPDPTGGFNPLPPPGLSLALAALLSVWDEEEAISSPTREETFPGSKASPAACRGAYRPQTVAKRPIDSTHADRLHQEGTATRDLADLEEGPEGSAFDAGASGGFF